MNSFYDLEAIKIFEKSYSHKVKENNFIFVYNKLS